MVTVFRGWLGVHESGASKCSLKIGFGFGDPTMGNLHFFLGYYSLWCRWLQQDFKLDKSGYSMVTL